MKPLKVKCWYVETRKVYGTGVTFWSRWQEAAYHDRGSAIAHRDAKLAAGETREMRIVAIDFRGRVIPAARIPEGV